MSRNTQKYTIDKQSKNIVILLDSFYFIAYNRNSDVMYQIPVTLFSSKATLHYETQKPVVSTLFCKTEQYLGILERNHSIDTYVHL